ncbi:hypothetical protein ENTB43_204 [Enterobacter phage Entb_43]|nr:hypothetical protein ENTB43_204 [Enterobacter phage Entb_43]
MLNLITAEELVEIYEGTHHDGIRIFKNSRPLGYITDLRVAYSRDQKRQKARKEYSNRVNEERAEKMPEAVEEMRSFLDNHLAKYGAEVMINISQPNVHVNGCKCYIIVDPIYGKHRLGVSNPRLSASEMAEMVDPCFKIQNSPAEHHILINGLSQDDIVQAIIKLCSK